MRTLGIGAAALTRSAIVPGPVNAQPAPNPDVQEMVERLTPPPVEAPVRGIRVGLPAAARVQPPAVSLNVLFRTGSAELTPEASQTLNDLGHALANPALSTSRFRVEGRTDTVGDRGYNLSLSDRRANAVAGYLAERCQVDRARLQPSGLGQDGLLVPTPGQTPEPRNRRVLIVNIGG